MNTNLFIELRELNQMENEIGSFNLNLLTKEAANQKEFDNMYNKVLEVIKTNGMKYISEYSDLYEEIDISLEDGDKNYFKELSGELNNSVKLNEKYYI